MSCCFFVVSMAASTFQVYLGRLSFQNPTPNEILRQLRRFIVHPEFSKRSKTNDIALLELDSPVTFTNYTRPVCLAADGSEFEPGTDCWLTGWGRAKSSGRTSPFLRFCCQEQKCSGEMMGCSEAVEASTTTTNHLQPLLMTEIRSLSFFFSIFSEPESSGGQHPYRFQQ